MKAAVIGSRELEIKCIAKYIPNNATEIVSGGAKGVDTAAKEYALLNNIKLTEFLPEYAKYGKFAPLKRNISIIEYSDIVICLWNGKSRGTKFVIENCKKKNVPYKVFILNNVT